MTAIDHQVVLDCIARKLREVERLMIDTADCITAKILLEECKVNLDRIAPLISQAIFNPIDDSITGLISICNSQPPGVNLQLDTGYRAERPLTGSRGRPAIVIPIEQLKALHGQGCSAKEMSVIFKCSPHLVYKRLYAANIHQRDKYSTLPDVNLKVKVTELHESFPNSGSTMMAGYLASTGVNVQRTRLRTSLRECDPIGTARRWGKTVDRRVYRVAMPNSLWHLDSHMKLIRWGYDSNDLINNDDEASLADECSSLLPMTALEGDVLYTLAGWTVFKEKTKIKQCSVCLSAILGDKNNAPEQSLLTVLKSFSTGAGLTHPSKTVLEEVIAAESLFQKNRANLTSAGDVHSFLMQGFSNQFAVNGFPTCHNALSNIVARYFRLRVYMLAKKMTSDFKKKCDEVQHGSKSAHCRTKIK